MSTREMNDVTMHFMFISTFSIPVISTLLLRFVQYVEKTNGNDECCTQNLYFSYMFNVYNIMASFFYGKFSCDGISSIRSSVRCSVRSIICKSKFKPD